MPSDLRLRKGEPVASGDKSAQKESLTGSLVDLKVCSLIPAAALVLVGQGYGRMAWAAVADPVPVGFAPSLVPRNAAVDPGLRAIRVTFSRLMLDRFWSWAQVSSHTFPEIVGWAVFH